MHPIRIALSSIVGSCLLAAGVLASGPAKEAPDVPLTLDTGTIVRPSDYKGKVLMVDFWASWCIPCRASFPAFDALYQKTRERGFEMLAINVDEMRINADRFLATHGHHMPIVYDPKGDAPKAFAIGGMPSSVLIDRAGRIRYTHVGYSTKILDSYRQEVELLLAEQP